MSSRLDRDAAGEVLHSIMEIGIDNVEDRLDALEACVCSDHGVTGRLDRDAACDVLLKIFGYVDQGPSKRAAALDALEACVRPAPQQIIDREALGRLLADAKRHPEWNPERYGERIMSLLRPIDGVTLTREERSEVLRWKRAYDYRHGSDVANDALHARLEAGS